MSEAPHGRSLRALTVVWIVLASPATRAVELAAPARAVTLPEALAYARERQPRIKSALAEYQARRAEARLPRAQWLPQLGATAQLFVATANNTTASYLTVPEMDIPRIGGSKSQTQATATWSPSASTLAGIGVGQEVYDFGRISAQISAADAYAAMARANVDAVGLDVALGVEEAFHAVLAGKAVLTATEDALKRAVTHRDYAQAGTRSGMRPPIDLTRAQADVSALQVRLIQAETGLQASRAALAAAMGSDQLEVDA
ncbi:MAG TPA: TolC family protein, partial [Polyangia bacterium]